MRAPLFRDVPPRAALVVVALVLAAGVVTGAPWTSSPQPPAEPVARPVATEERPAAAPLDIESMERRKTSGTVPDLFVTPVPVAPAGTRASVVAAAAPAAPPVPVVPALPFRYLGRMDDGERAVVFLERGQDLYSVGVGDTVGATYRVEALSDTAVTFRHLSLGVAQTLAIPKAP